MPRYTTKIASPMSPADAFAYLSDFATTEEWDPGVARAERLTEGPIREGSEFRVVARFLGRDVPLVYVVETLQTPSRVVLRGENATTVSLDEIRVAPDGTGCEVTYDAKLSFKGVLRVAEPALAVIFRVIGDRAAGGLRQALRAA